MTINKMVREAVDCALADEKLASPSLVACAVIGELSQGFADNDDGALACVAAFGKTRDIARQQINSLPPQIPGFERLQGQYVIHRNGDDLAVPITLCTDAELEARAAELVKMAKGSLAHAKEIRAYIASRPAVAA